MKTLMLSLAAALTLTINSTASAWGVHAGPVTVAGRPAVVARPVPVVRPVVRPVARPVVRPVVGPVVSPVIGPALRPRVIHERRELAAEAIQDRREFARETIQDLRQAALQNALSNQ